MGQTLLSDWRTTKGQARWYTSVQTASSLSRPGVSRAAVLRQARSEPRAHASRLMVNRKTTTMTRWWRRWWWWVVHVVGAGVHGSDGTQSLTVQLQRGSPLATELEGNICNWNQCQEMIKNTPNPPSHSHNWYHLQQQFIPFFSYFPVYFFYSLLITCFRGCVLCLITCHY